jgi:CheY-like chemotaxis protein
MINTDTIKTVCIIDDDEIHHYTLEKTIQLQGYLKNMLSFHDGYAAINFFTQNIKNDSVLPDIVFLDLNMPIVNGWQFLQQYALIKSQIKKDIKIYVVSSSINNNEITRATSINEVSGYLEKPLKPAEIIQVFSSPDIN